MNNRAVVFFEENGVVRVGLVENERVMDVTAAVETVCEQRGGDPRLALFDQWESCWAMLNKLAFSGTLVQTELRLLPPLHPFATMYCAGANYRSHILEMAKANQQEPDADPKLSGQQPWHFIKPARVCAVGQEAEVRRPALSQRVDWEAELAVVIGRQTEQVGIEDALSYVAGYACANDFSARDLSRRPQVQPGSPFRFDWLAHKCFPGSSPVGPVLVPASHVPDPQDLGIRLRLNGALKQDAHTSDMIFTVAEQIAHLSSMLTLYPGDVVLTGTPAGVGSATQTFLKAGDRVEVEIDGLGILTTRVV